MTCAETCSGDRGRCNPINGKCRCFPGYRGLDCEFGKFSCSAFIHFCFHAQLLFVSHAQFKYEMLKSLINDTS